MKREQFLTGWEENKKKEKKKKEKDIPDGTSSAKNMARVSVDFRLTATDGTKLTVEEFRNMVEGPNRAPDPKKGKK